MYSVHNIFLDFDVEAHLFYINAYKCDKVFWNPILLSYVIVSDHPAIMSPTKPLVTHTGPSEQHWKIGSKLRGKSVDELFVNDVLRYSFKTESDLESIPKYWQNLKNYIV